MVEIYSVFKLKRNNYVNVCAHMERILVGLWSQENIYLEYSKLSDNRSEEP
jgi:hypothetical protein